MLAKVHKDDSIKPRYMSHFNETTKLESMTITYYSELALFLQSINASYGTFTVEYRPPGGSPDSIDIPLEPVVNDLKPVDVSLHQSPAQAYNMGETINTWFSKCCGFDVVLLYLGPNRRPVLGNLAPNAAAAKSQSWLSSVKSSMLDYGTKEAKAQLSFADVAAYLVITEESLQEVSSRLSDGSQVDVTKFRPNIVVSGAPEAWDEDYWGTVSVMNGIEGKGSHEKTDLVLTQNCARCVSINVDYDTGKAGKGGQGDVLKKMMKDRRIDKGSKYSPIFGRYGFLDPETSSEPRSIAVGDEAIVSKRNAERTTFGDE